jgi:hypothetical protein
MDNQSARKPTLSWAGLFEGRARRTTETAAPRGHPLWDRNTFRNPGARRADDRKNGMIGCREISQDSIL